MMGLCSTINGPKTNVQREKLGTVDGQKVFPGIRLRTRNGRCRIAIEKVRVGHAGDQW